MRRGWSWILIVASVMIALLISTAAMAENPVGLYVNGEKVTSDVPPQIINDRTMVPIRWVAEALNAEVSWDGKERNVYIKTADRPADSGQRRTALLESWIAPDSASGTAELWAKAVKLRNGAVQFAVLSSELQNKTRGKYESVGWDPGVSSPWVERYTISEIEAGADNQKIYEVTFYMTTSTGPAGSGTVQLTVEKSDNRWEITQLKDVHKAATLAVVILPDSDDGSKGQEPSRQVRLTNPEGIHMINAEAGFAWGFVDNETIFMLTKDEGVTWKQVSLKNLSFQGYEHPVQMSFTDEQHGWVLTVGEAAMNQSEKKVHRTVNGGDTWEVVSSNSSYNVAKNESSQSLPRVVVPAEMVFLDSETGFVSMDNPVSDQILFFRTTDGGITWNQVRLDVPEVVGNYEFTRTSQPIFAEADHQEGAIVIEFNRSNSSQIVAYHTSNGGDIWSSGTMITKETTLKDLDHLVIVNSEEGWMVNDGRLYRTQDGGASWQPVSVDSTFSKAVKQYPVVKHFETAGEASILLHLVTENLEEALLIKTDNGGKTWSVLSVNAK